jgi:hypothetical protein
MPVATPRTCHHLRQRRHMPLHHGLRCLISKVSNSQVDVSPCNNQEAVEDVAGEDTSDVLEVEDEVESLYPCHSLVGLR